MPNRVVILLEKLRHLNRIRSVRWTRLARVIPQVWLDYRSARGVSRSLLNVTLEVTYRCNARCAFCFAHKEPVPSERRELSVSEVHDLVDSVATLTPGFFITGGEPFVRSDMMQILEAIKRRGSKMGVNTNLSLMNDTVASELREVGLDYLIVSLHGPRNTHDTLAGIEIHDAVLDNIARLRNLSPRTRVLVNCVIVPENIGVLAGVVQEAARAGAHALTLQHETFITPGEVETHERVWRAVFGERIPVPLGVPIRATGRCSANAVDEALRAAREAGSRAHLPVFVKPGLDNAALFDWHEGSFTPRGRCSYLYTDARITPYGDVVACQSLPLVLGNVREQPLPEIFNDETAALFRRYLHSAGGCVPGCSRCCKLYRSF